MKAAMARRMLIGLALLLASTVGASAAPIEVLWLGHGTIRIKTVEGETIVIDPFLVKNPSTPVEYRDLEALGPVDLILVTHGHTDHIDDLVELAKLNDAPVVLTWELATQLTTLGLLDAAKIVAMNKGGTVSPLGRGIEIHMLPAEHSSSLDLVAFDLFAPGQATPDAPRLLEGGMAVSYVIELENGFTIYHTGDTWVFGDMALIQTFFEPDLALVPIGGHFTMGPIEAAYAVENLIQPKRAIPIHYGTYPVINRSPAEFVAALGDAPIEVLVMQPGQTATFQ